MILIEVSVINLFEKKNFKINAQEKKIIYLKSAYSQLKVSKGSSLPIKYIMRGKLSSILL